MKHSPQQGEMQYYCEPCQDFTTYEERDVDAYCPDCQHPLTVSASCGCQGFFCQSCKSVKSSKRVVWKEA
jgi:hypothetical protein